MNEIEKEKKILERKLKTLWRMIAKKFVSKKQLEVYKQSEEIVDFLKNILMEKEPGLACLLDELYYETKRSLYFVGSSHYSCGKQKINYGPLIIELNLDLFPFDCNITYKNEERAMPIPRYDDFSYPIIKLVGHILETCRLQNKIWDKE